MAGLVVKPRARILHGHDWVFSGEVLKAFGNPADGDVISLKDGRDHLIGSAIYNSKSQIVARRFSRRRQDLDLDFFQRRIAQAVEYRKRRGVDLRLCRLVWSESDGLPGVIVDRYGDYAVLQTLTLAMDMRKALIVEALKAATEPPNLQSIIERNDAPVRRAEGMELQVGVLLGEAPSRPVVIEINGTPERASLQLEIDLMHAQKTGFYLDQLGHYETVARYAAGAARAGLFCESGRVRARVCASRRGESDGGGSERGKHRKRTPKRRTEPAFRRVDRAGRFSIPARGGKGGSGIRFDYSRSAFLHQNERRIARRVARISRTARARV